MEYLQPIFIVAVGCGIAVAIGLYVYHHHVASKSPAPATVAHISALGNKVDVVAAKIETSNVLGAIKQRVEDLHDKFDKKEGK